MTISDPIYKYDSAGKLRFWRYEVDGEKFRTIAGIVAGTPVYSEWTVCTSRNAGRANYKTAYQQAEIQAKAEEEKKLKREYRRTHAELESVMEGPMLAHTFKGNIKFPVFSQPKLDGIRALITKDGAFTRSLQPHFNVDHILRELEPLFQADPELVLDGELYNHDLHDNFNRICQLVRKQTVTDEESRDIERLVQFHIYDVPSSVGFEERSLDLATFEDLFFTSKVIKTVQTDHVHNQAQLDAFYEDYLERGYEGQMVRLSRVPYEFDTRSKSLLKRKEFETSEFLLVDVQEGEGNWAGYAKKIVFELEDERQCGGGIKGDQDYTRKLLSEVKAGIGPKYATVRYFKRTPDGMPRFPVAIDFHNGRVD